MRKAWRPFARAGKAASVSFIWSIWFNQIDEMDQATVIVR